MKIISLLSFIVIGLVSLQQQAIAQTTKEDDLIALNFELVDGFVDPDGTIMGSFLQWTDNTKEIKGIPPGLKEVKIATVVFDEPQYNYQLFRAGRMDSATYNQKATRFKNSVKFLADHPIKCFGYILSALNEKGDLIIIYDSNNDQDFNNEFQLNINEMPDHDFKGYTKHFNAEFASDKGVRSVLVPLHINYNGAKGNITQISYNFPLHAITNLEKDGLKYEIKFSTQYSMAMHFLGAQFYVSRTDKSDIAVEQQKVIRIGKDVYENMGIDIHARILYLKKINDDNVISPRVGFNAPKFSVKEVNTKAEITLDKYKGKYLLIDFWATWCPPCIASMQVLKEQHKMLASNNIALLGVNIAVKEDLSKVKKMIADKGFFWDQVYSDDLTQLFNVGAIPSNFLIGPDGKIVAKDLNIDNLEKEIAPFVKN